MLNALNDSALCLMVSVCHRTGLFDTMRDFQPANSGDIAIRAGLNERYVRECLSALLTSGVVEFEPSTQHLSLPPEHAGYLTRAAGADNIGAFAQYIAGSVASSTTSLSALRKAEASPIQDFPAFTR